MARTKTRLARVHKEKDSADIPRVGRNGDLASVDSAACKTGSESRRSIKGCEGISQRPR